MFRVEYHNYLCHPETCCHNDHKSWWLMRDDELYMRFDSKDEAEEKIKEIAAGHRIDLTSVSPTSDTSDDSDLEYHVSPLCKIEVK